MSGVSLDNLLLLQGINTSTSSVSNQSTSSNQSFSALLAEEMSDVIDEISTGTSSAVATNNSDSNADLLLNLCLMMCAGSSSNPLIMSMLSAMSESSGIVGSSGLSTSANGLAVVDAAMTRLGDPYSKTLRGMGDYVDCSYLAQWAYEQVGVSLPSTAAAQAEYCYDNGYTISESELQPGDLVFWTNHSSNTGRWNEIRHVGIYAGNNQVIEAKTSTGDVAVNEMWGQDGGQWEVFMYARPTATDID